jgi:uncharacterized membrane protein YgaE (UPF0421/DUF939 family)
MAPRNRFTQLMGFLRNRTRVGLRRSRNSIFPALQITAGGVGAYAFAQFVLGHDGPIFAATSALIALGFSREARVRRVLEVAAGCTLGIAVGDTLLHLLGTGIWQAAVVLFLSVLLARFLDTGNVFTTQLGLQSLLVVMLPAPVGGPFTRSLDAVVGGLVALLLTMVVPRDPRREPKTDVRVLLGELSQVLRETARAITRSDSTLAWHALVRARSCQPKVDSMNNSLRAAKEVATLSPAYRRHREELEDLGNALHFIDLAIRNSRVFSRRLTSLINHAALSDEAIESLSTVLEETAEAVDVLAVALSSGDSVARERQLRRARHELASIITRMHPRTLGASGLEAEGFVLLFRPFMVDLLEATGLTHEEAAGYLPRL